jgi:hypothetical protein
MPPHYLAGNGAVHLSGRLGLAAKPQTADYLIEVDGGEPASRPQQNSIAGFFDGEFRTRLPSAGIPDRFGQNDLAFCRKPCGFRFHK